MSHNSLTEHPIYGASRLGVYNRKSKTTHYQLTDHLGNVRAVIAKQGSNAAALTAKTDYYPFGMPMPNRNVEGDYRYKFQGQEKDKETGMEAFELRLWDSRIGRWLTTDPMGEFFSPYLGMGNNPISLIDPTGGSTDCPDCPPNTIHLEGVTVTAPRLGGGFDFSGMPDWLRFNQPDTWNTSFVGDLDEYNRAHKTNYTDGNQFNQWYFQNHYKPEYDDMISKIHSAQVSVGLTTLAVPALIIGAAETLPLLSAVTEAGSLSATTYEGTMFRHGMYRLTIRNSAGQFANGNGVRLTGRVFYQRYGLNGLGQATRTTPVTPPNWGSIAKWGTGAGLSGATSYYLYQELLKK